MVSHFLCLACLSGFSIESEKKTTVLQLSLAIDFYNKSAAVLTCTNQQKPVKYKFKFANCIL